MPFLLDATGSGESVLPMIVGLLVLAGFVAWNLIKLFGSVANLSKHPVAKSLSRFGDWRQMAQEIDTQMAEPHETHGEFFHLTRDWLVYQSKTRFEAVPYRDLVWQYMLPITYRSFGIVTGKAYNLIVFDRCGKSRSLTLGKAGEAALDLQNKLQSHAPWSFSGYSVETETAWNREREKMIAWWKPANWQLRIAVLRPKRHNTKRMVCSKMTALNNQMLTRLPWRAIERKGWH